MGKIKTVQRSVNGIVVEQRTTDGFINGTAMCVAHSKLIADWFRNQETIELLHALSGDLGFEVNYGISHNSSIASISAIYPHLVVSKRGSPDTGGGTWLHYDLAVQLAQWCSAAFAIQVSRWVREWLTTGQNPIVFQADLDRVVYRDTLKDDSRLRMTNQVKIFLEKIKKYDDKKYCGKFFAQVHDAINISITGETAREMKARFSKTLGRPVKESELIRDYFPPLHLQKYIAVCEAVANFIIKEGLHPLIAVERAAEIVLPANYLPEPVEAVENIKFVRQRLHQPLIGASNPNF